MGERAVDHGLDCIAAWSTSECWVVLCAREGGRHGHVTGGSGQVDLNILA